MSYSPLKVIFTPSRPEESHEFTIPYYLGEGHDYPAVRPKLYNNKAQVYYGHRGGYWMESLEVVMKDNFTNIFLVNVYPYYHIMAISPNGEHLVTHQYADGQGALYETTPLSLELSNQFLLPGFIERVVCR
ncbi:MAG: hypothetical protein U5K79_02320 [Cyclobacteriaceae bacterium]|nr:hypothetical protein [Cyclobacteriaceae bacterium]